MSKLSERRLENLHRISEGKEEDTLGGLSLFLVKLQELGGNRYADDVGSGPGGYDLKRFIRRASDNESTAEERDRLVVSLGKMSKEFEELSKEVSKAIKSLKQFKYKNPE